MSFQSKYLDSNKKKLLLIGKIFWGAKAPRPPACYGTDTRAMPASRLIIFQNIFGMIQWHNYLTELIPHSFTKSDFRGCPSSLGISENPFENISAEFQLGYVSGCDIKINGAFRTLPKNFDGAFWENSLWPSSGNNSRKNLHHRYPTAFVDKVLWAKFT